MKLYQIKLTKSLAKRVNAGEKVPEYTAYCDASMLGKFPGRDFYSYVADIATDDLNVAFQVGNIGPEEQITRHDQMHSVSVGDVLVKADGTAYMVASVGFDKVEWQV